MRNQTNDELRRLICDLESAISLAVENPILFGDSPTVQALAASCRALVDLRDVAAASGQNASAKPSEPDLERAALVWQVRQRAGRLQLLMDSAARFYTTCFSSSQPDELAYGVHGEWNVMRSAGHLIVDC